MTAAHGRAWAWLRRRWVLLVVAVAVAAFLGWNVHGAVDAARSRRRLFKDAAAQRARIEELGNTVVATQVDIQRSLAILQSATSPEAQQRQAAVLAGAIDDLRRSIDCSALYAAGMRPPPCAEVDARLDALRAGVDPFARPPTQPGGP